MSKSGIVTFAPSMIGNLGHILAKELLIELRSGLGFLSALLYLVAISFVVFKVFGSFDGPVKMGLFWVIFLFTCINIVGLSFSNQNSRRKLSYYQLYDPVELFLAKFVFSLIKVLIAGLVLIALQTILGGQALTDMTLFGKTFILSSIGLTLVLCLISAIASYGDNQNTLVAVLSLPLVIPVLLLSMRLSLISERFFSDPATGKYLMMLSGIDLLLLSLSVIFIPLIWKS